MDKQSQGYFFEDFTLGQVLHHATPRTLNQGDASLYTAMTGSRFAVQSADQFAEQIGLGRAPLDSLLVFHTVFGKTVPDISLNAIANLGYAEGQFFGEVYPGASLSSRSEVIGKKEISSGKAGIVYVRTEGRDEKGKICLSFIRWVMVRKRDAASPAPEPVVPKLQESVDIAALADQFPRIDHQAWDARLSGSAHFFEDYQKGEKIDHIDGMTIEEAEHQIATRLYQNTAKVHFNQFAEGQGRFGRRLIYGGHVISLARALSFNGLANAFQIVAINGGSHANPLFAGLTVFAWSEVLDKQDLPGREDIGALRLRLVATKDHPCADFPLKTEAGGYHEEVLLDFDYWAVMPKSPSA